MSDANQNRESENQSEQGTEKRGSSPFARFILNFIIYFGLGYLLITALGLGR